MNQSDALQSVLAEGQSTWPYWVQTAMLAGIWLVLTVLYVRRH